MSRQINVPRKIKRNVINSKALARRNVAPSNVRLTEDAKVKNVFVAPRNAGKKSHAKKQEESASPTRGTASME